MGPQMICLWVSMGHRDPQPRKLRPRDTHCPWHSSQPQLDPMVTNKHIPARGEKQGLIWWGTQNKRLQTKMQLFPGLPSPAQPGPASPPVSSCTTMTPQTQLLSFSSPVIPEPSYLRAFACDTHLSGAFLPSPHSPGSRLSSFPSQLAVTRLGKLSQVLLPQSVTECCTFPSWH